MADVDQITQDFAGDLCEYVEDAIHDVATVGRMCEPFAGETSEVHEMVERCHADLAELGRAIRRSFPKTQPSEETPS